VAFDVALIACPVMQFYCGTPMYLLSGVDSRGGKISGFIVSQRLGTHPGIYPGK